MSVVSRRYVGAVARLRRATRVGRFGLQPAHALMRERGIPQAELMALTGRSNGHVSNVLNGVQVPDAAFIQAVCAFLGLESEQLVTPPCWSSPVRGSGPRTTGSSVGRRPGGKAPSGASQRTGC